MESLHRVTIHFPIALWMTAFGVEMAAMAFGAHLGGRLVYEFGVGVISPIPERVSG